MIPSATALRTGPATRAAEREAAAARVRQRLAGGTRRYSPTAPGRRSPTTSGRSSRPSCFRRGGAGRPVRDPRAGAWTRSSGWRPTPPPPAGPSRPGARLPAGFGKPDTAARQFRRRAQAGLWTRLLEALADPDRPGTAILRRLESWICRSYRRAWRLAPARRARRRARPPPGLLLRHARALRLPARPPFVRTRQKPPPRGPAMPPRTRPRSGAGDDAPPGLPPGGPRALRNATGARRISRLMAPP
jgi:hypothetical protein